MENPIHNTPQTDTSDLCEQWGIIIPPEISPDLQELFTFIFTEFTRLDEGLKSSAQFALRYIDQDFSIMVKVDDTEEDQAELKQKYAALQEEYRGIIEDEKNRYFNDFVAKTRTTIQIIGGCKIVHARSIQEFRFNLTQDINEVKRQASDNFGRIIMGEFVAIGTDIKPTFQRAVKTLTG